MSSRSSNKTVYSAKYRLIWCPKYRRRVALGDVEARLAHIVGAVCTEVQAEALGFGVMPGHLDVEIQKQVAYMAACEARYRYRLRVSPAEALALRGVFDACRLVWRTWPSGAGATCGAM